MNRIERYYRDQTEHSAMRELVKKELASLDIGVQIGKLRAKHGLVEDKARRRHFRA